MRREGTRIRSLTLIDRLMTTPPCYYDTYTTCMPHAITLLLFREAFFFQFLNKIK